MACALVDNAPTEKVRACTLLALMGLRVREIAHASSLWLQEDDCLRIPRIQPCDCQTCRRRPRDARYQGREVETMRHDDEPMYGSGKMLQARTIDLKRLGDRGRWLADYLRQRGRQLGFQHKEVADAIRTTDASPGNLRAWAGIFLHQCHGIPLQTVAVWRGEGVAVGRNLGIEDLKEEVGKVYSRLATFDEHLNNDDER